MLTGKELRVVELFRKNVFASYTIREIMKLIKTKSYNWTYTTVKKLEKENIINTEEKGKSTLCSINLEEENTIKYLSFLEGDNPLIKKVPNLEKIKELLPFGYDFFLIAGSYADGSYTSKSDLDIVVVNGESQDKRRENKFLLNKLSNEGDLMIPKLHPYVFTVMEFLDMLTNKEENYGKEIAKKHLIISGAEFYYYILREAINRGFRG